MKQLALSIFFLAATLVLFAQEKDLSDSAVFTKTEVEAEFSGGTTAWINYLRKNLRANTPIRNGAPLGSYLVIVRFIVDRTGKISNVVAETKLGFGMEQEVIRIIRTGPAWVPAVQNRVTVNAYRRQPVRFVVGGEGILLDSPPVLQIGKENSVTVTGSRLRDKEIEVVSDNGTVSQQSNGRFTVIPAEDRLVILEFFEVKKTRRKPITRVAFQVMSGEQIKSIVIK